MFLIAYDITDDRRLKRIARLMEAYGTRVQKSVFECVISDSQLDALLHDVKRLMKGNEDKVQVYSLCEACRQRTGATSPAKLERQDVYIC